MTCAIAATRKSSRVRLIQLSRWRRKAIVILFAVAAVVTPSSDPFSMLALAIPMCVFYEVSILIGKFLKRSPAPTGGS